KPHLLNTPGESQIVDPSGAVLAKGAFLADTIIYAVISPSDADGKDIAGCGDLFADRRPDAYGLLTTPNEELPLSINPSNIDVAPFTAAAIQTVCLSSDIDMAVLRALDIVEEAADRGARLIVLPELFPFEDNAISAD